MHSIETLLSAYAALPEAGAGALDREAEQRLQALLADGVLPLLLRCLKAWKAGARPCNQRVLPFVWLRTLLLRRLEARQTGARRSRKKFPAAARLLWMLVQRGSGQGSALRGVVTQQEARPSATRSGRALPLLAEERTLQRLPSASAVLRGGPVLLGSPGAAARPAACRKGVLAAGQQQGPDASATLCGVALGKLLGFRRLCERVPLRARMRGARYLYTLLQTASQRVAELVRVRRERVPTGGLQAWRSAVHPCRPPACAASLTRRGCTPGWAGACGAALCAPGSLVVAELRSPCLCAWHARVCAAVMAGAEKCVMQGPCHDALQVAQGFLRPLPGTQACSLSLGPDGSCAGHRGCLSQSAHEANARLASRGSIDLLLVHTCVDLASYSTIWSALVRPQLVPPGATHACSASALPQGL
jgi:hypothetical protein